MSKILCALLLINSSVLIASNLPDKPSLYVTAEAELKVAPEIARVSFQLMEFNSDPADALNTVLTRGEEVIKLATDLGIPKGKITSLQLRKETVRVETDGYEDLEIKGYEVAQSYFILIDDIDIYSKFADSVISLKNINQIRAEFDVNDRDKITKQLVEAAAQKVRAKAENLATSMRVKLGDLFTVTEDGGFDGAYASFAFSRQEYISVTGSRKQRSNMFVPKTITLSKTINAIYLIEQ